MPASIHSNHSHSHTGENEHDSNDDPFLSIDAHLRPQTLYQHQHHGHSSVDQADIDPALEERERTPGNRLTDFASHILGSQDGHEDPPSGPGQGHDEHEHEHGHEHGHDLSFTGEGGVLESSSHPFHVDVDVGVGVGDSVEQAVRMAAMEDEGEFEPHIEDDGHGHGHGSPGHEQHHEHHVEGQEQGQIQQGEGEIRPPKARRGNYGKGRKRNHGGEIVDSAIVRKENHKEVERKRRNNISEGIDQLVAQMAIPELEKAGKGVQLRRAVDYMADLGERVGGLEKECEDLRKDKQDLEANLALTSQRYTEEHERCTRYETLWRDAQDREAKGQFEIAQLLDEISQLRAKR